MISLSLKTWDIFSTPRIYELSFLKRLNNNFNGVLEKFAEYYIWKSEIRIKTPLLFISFVEGRCEWIFKCKCDKARSIAFDDYPKCFGITFDRALLYFQKYCLSRKMKIAARNNALLKLAGSSFSSSHGVLLFNCWVCLPSVVEFCSHSTHQPCALNGSYRISTRDA